MITWLEHDCVEESRQKAERHRARQMHPTTYTKRVTRGGGRRGEAPKKMSIVFTNISLSLRGNDTLFLATLGVLPDRPYAHSQTPKVCVCLRNAHVQLNIDMHGVSLWLALVVQLQPSNCHPISHSIRNYATKAY
jgi:hypothetical protein